MKNKFINIDETLDDLQLNNIFIIQKKDAFRFGVDAVLLANFVKDKRNAKVIDLCTGTGIIPFILSQKTKVSDITGIEIQEEMVDMASRSVLFNRLEGKIRFINHDLRDIKFVKGLEKVDIVTVNPPYKLKGSGIINSNDKNAIARHEICCTLEDVVKASKVLLTHNGKFYMIHRPDRLVDIMCIMRKYKIEPKFITMIYPNVKKAPNMVLVEGQNNGGKFLRWGEPIYIHSLDGSYTDQIEKIYGRN
ncbi:tRNA1(Val) (adenine(37)-N6)-methyltransferase [Clostridium fermenticellae]|uniref:tRNA1(Val) (Adenine(37)-N6)-methyltransferase n=1 Tax=Clostridium fermenticellae TaxID=2068654 RepID=A0A386H0B8_9CLOT|nr:tRNA1(Val) (adenine(37)-N6)-methyltransferase [Clostridium fermenticellae]AYD39112.1 tRNA1(Val) (adenine(37)-N6)-methyltransferase [Clostridium fermenticellae]